MNHFGLLDIIFNSTSFFFITEAFTTFPLLQELELMLNSIVDVSINQGDFRQLQVG